MATGRHLGFYKIPVFNSGRVWSGTVHHPAKFHRDSSKCCKLWRYSNFKFLKMAAIRHLGCLESQIFIFARLQSGAVHQCARFHRNILNSCTHRTFFVLSIWLENTYSGPFWDFTNQTGSNVKGTLKEHEV